MTDSKPSLGSAPKRIPWNSIAIQRKIKMNSVLKERCSFSLEFWEIPEESLKSALE